MSDWSSDVCSSDLLDEGHVLLPGVGIAAPDRADDAGGDRVVEPERRADRDRPLPRLERIGAADAQRRQAVGIDLEQGDVRLHVATHHLGGEFAAVRQLDLDLAGAIDDMRSEEHTSELQSLMRISY